MISTHNTKTARQQRGFGLIALLGTAVVLVVVGVLLRDLYQTAQHLMDQMGATR